MISLFEVDWFGPYKSVREVSDRKNILYMWTGQLLRGLIQKYQEKGTTFTRERAIRYVGRTVNSIGERTKGVHHCKELSKNKKEFWVGRISYARASNIENTSVNNAEKLLIFYLYKQFHCKNIANCMPVQLLNVKNTQSMSVENFGIVNRWFFKNGKARDYRHLPWFNKFFDDIIMCEDLNQKFIAAKNAVSYELK